jgi:hypothetical protein
MPELFVFVWMMFGDQWEKFEHKLPPRATRSECMRLAEELAQFAILVSENKTRVQFGCRESQPPHLRSQEEMTPPGFQAAFSVCVVGFDSGWQKY